MTPEEECLKLWEDRGEALYSGTTLLGVNRSFIHFRDGYDAACLSAQEYVKEGETVGAAVKRHWQDSQHALAELAKEKTRTEKALARIAELEAALKGMTNHYCELILSGNAGIWNPEDEPPVEIARAALAKGTP